MSIDYTELFHRRVTPSPAMPPGWRPVPGRHRGNSSAFDDWNRLDRFLVLGTEGPTYFAGAQDPTLEDCDAVGRCIAADGARVVERTVEVSAGGRPPSKDPAIQVLTRVAVCGDSAASRAHAFACVPRVCRTPEALFRFARWVEAWRGGGPGVPRALPGSPAGELSRLLNAVEQVRRAERVSEVVRGISEHPLPREAIPTRWLGDAEVWAALLPRMPVTSLLRDLDRMTVAGLLQSGSEAVGAVVARLGQTEVLAAARVHPLAVLLANRAYGLGHRDRGRLRWSPVAAITEALDEAFYASFAHVPRVGRPVLMSLDVSGSMASSRLADSGLSAREASAAWALITVTTEPGSVVVGFTAAAAGCGGKWGGGEPGITLMDVRPGMRLPEVVNRVSGLPFGGTDCALPIQWARRNHLDVAGFITCTDNETWAGKLEPAPALRGYRSERSPAARAVTVGMTSPGFSMADPADPGMLDVVGFDAGAPAVIAEFLRGGCPG